MSLELELREVGRDLAFPEGDLAPAVLARLDRPPRRRRALVVALATLALAVAVALAVPPARAAILDWLGIGGVRIERVDELPPVDESAPLDLGAPVTLDEARARVDWPLLAPGALGDPDAVHRREPPPGGAVTMSYRAGGELRLLFTQFRGDALGLAQKSLGAGTELRHVEVGGRPAVWISGRPHVFLYQDVSGELREEPRLAGNVLLWERDGVTLRLEGELELEDALELAASVER